MTPVLAIFIVQILLYSAFSFYVASLRNPLRIAAFYVYIGILLVIGGFLSSIYSLPVVPGLNISGGSLAYGALLMNTVMLVIIERDVIVARRVIQLVIVINIFKFFLFSLITLALQNDAVINPYNTDSGVFALSLPITLLGGFLILVELIILLYVFEVIKRRIANVTLVSTLYTICFVAVLCLDGVLFPLLAFPFSPQLSAIVIGGVESKLLMGLAYSLPMLFFLFLNRNRVSEFVDTPMTLSEMLRAPQERLVKEIERQRQSLELGEKQLRVYAERLALATESAGLGIWDLDIESDRIVWDPRSFEMYGFTPVDGDVSVEMWEQRVDPADLPGMHEEFEAALAGSKDYHAQFRVHWPDGQVRYIESFATVQRAADGKPLRLIGVNADITQRKLLAMENERLTEQFYHAQRLESIGRLAGGIAHDFNNVLVPISSFAELGQLKVEAGSKPYTYFKHIREAAERASNLTRQILTFSRNQALEMRPADLNEIVVNFQEMLERLIGVETDLQLDLTPEACTIMADPGQIEQVLMNLVVNARDAMPEGGTLKIATRKDHVDQVAGATVGPILTGDYATLVVSDSGVGMDEATKQRVFEPFFTTKPQGKGTGLGLSTVFGIVKQHHGNIQIDSEVGRGTVVSVFLPAAEEHPQSLTDAASRQV